MATRIVASGEASHQPAPVEGVTETRNIDESLDRLVELSHKLSALLVVTYGDSGDGFRRLSNGIQDAYLWTCSDMAQEDHELVRSIAQGVRHG